jgi:hypothetical protein
MKINIDLTKVTTLTQKQKDIIHATLRYMASLDPDQAFEKNDMGFNSYDSGEGHYLANRDFLSDGEAILGKKILFKYHRQIPEEWYKEIFGKTYQDIKKGKRR